MTIDINIFKQKLEEEKARLEAELKTIGKKDPSNKDNWEGTTPELNTAEEAETAEALTEFDTNSTLTSDLETRLLEVTKALEKISAGTYGLCEVSSDPIEEDRLMANPAARTCKMHMNSSAI
jgi:RNA polymerase-binding transcription factor DksA